MALLQTFMRSLTDLISPRDPLNHALLIRVLSAIETRFKPLESQRADLNTAIEQVRGVSLARINEVLTPAIQSVLEIQERGFLIARSTSPGELAVDNVLSLTIDDEAERRLFTPSRFVALSRKANTTDWAIAETLGYNIDSGLYVCRVITFSGDAGPHTDWEIGALAGSTIAQMQILSEIEAHRTFIQGLENAVETYRNTVVEKAATVDTQTTTVNTRHTQITGLVNDFAKRYLGIFETNPTTDVAGNAVQKGALAFIENEDDGISEMRVYLGSGVWKAAGSAVNGMLLDRPFTATAGQTTFDLGGDTYDPGFAKVYFNGVLLEKGEVNTSSGTGFVLTDPAEEGDKFRLIAFGAFNVANVVSPATLDAELQEFMTLVGTYVSGEISDMQTSVDAAVAAVGQSVAGTMTRITADAGTHAAIAGAELYADTDGGAVSIELPASPSNGNRVRVLRDGASNVTILRNGNTIAGFAEDLVIDEDKQDWTLTFMQGNWFAQARGFA